MMLVLLGLLPGCGPAQTRRVAANFVPMPIDACPPTLHETVEPSADSRWTLERSDWTLKVFRAGRIHESGAGPGEFLSCVYEFPPLRLWSTDARLVRSASAGNPCPDFVYVRREMPRGALSAGFEGGKSYVAGAFHRQGVPQVSGNKVVCTLQTNAFDSIQFPLREKPR